MYENKMPIVKYVRVAPVIRHSNGDEFEYVLDN